MTKAQEAIEQVAAYLANHLPLEGLEDWSASYVQNIHQTKDVEAQRIAVLIRSILNTYDEEESEDGLRLELAEAIRPYALFAENRYGDPSPSPAVQFDAGKMEFNHAEAA